MIRSSRNAIEARKSGMTAAVPYMRHNRIEIFIFAFASAEQFLTVTIRFDEIEQANPFPPKGFACSPSISDDDYDLC
jgi:hypothetical protein